MGELEPSDARGDGAGKRALDVAEQLRFHQSFGNRGGVERDEALIGARRVVVNGARHELLARPGLAMDQHCAVHGRHHLEGLEELLHRAVAADDAFEAEAAAELGAQLGVLHLEALLIDGGLENARQL
jgi:hypothetical protein